MQLPSLEQEKQRRQNTVTLLEEQLTASKQEVETLKTELAARNRGVNNPDTCAMRSDLDGRSTWQDQVQIAVAAAQTEKAADEAAVEGAARADAAEAKKKTIQSERGMAEKHAAKQKEKNANKERAIALAVASAKTAAAAASAAVSATAAQAKTKVAAEVIFKRREKRVPTVPSLPHLKQMRFGMLQPLWLCCIIGAVLVLAFVAQICIKDDSLIVSVTRNGATSSSTSGFDSNIGFLD